MLHKMAGVFETLRVRPERMWENLQATRGMAMAEAVMLALAEEGMGRQEAHELVRGLSLKAKEEGRTLGEALEDSRKVVSTLSKEELAAALDPKRYLGASVEIVDRVVALCEGSG